MHFTPKSDFWSPEFKSQYIAGLIYTIRNERLRDIAETWKAEGRIVFLEPKDIGPRVSGQDKPKSFLERIKSWL